MEIAFLGDSITEGIHGCSFIDIVQREIPNLRIDNYGKGGDTVKSLYRRVKKIEHLKEYDMIFLFVGINDILGKISLFYRSIKTIRQQPSSKDLKEFELYYNKLIHFLLETKSKIVVIPPLFIGENIKNEWNKLVIELVDSIEHIIETKNEILYLNIRDDFSKYLSGRKISNYIPEKAMDMKRDGDHIKKGIDIDSISEKRGLHTTIDGVHLNTVGANLIANRIIRFLNR